LIQDLLVNNLSALDDLIKKESKNVFSIVTPPTVTLDFLGDTIHVDIVLPIRYGSKDYDAHVS
jgi:hypothetical protein